MNSDTSKVLDLLETAGGKLVAEEDIIRTDDNTLALPRAMSFRDAITFFRMKMEEEDSMTNFRRVYRFRPWDGAQATHRALKRAFGMVALSGIGWSAPSMVNVPTGVGESTDIPWGEMTIPVLPSVTFTVGGTRDEDAGQLFELSAYGPRHARFAVNGVFELVQRELETDSIYRGKAFDGRARPEFIDVHAVDRSKIVYADGTEDELLTNVWSLLRWTDAHRAIGLPLKRTILLQGPYGTGKTVGATITAQEAVAHGWTFIYCQPGRDNIAECLQTAKLYQPAVVFFEDVDVISDPETTGVDGVTKLLDIFDGIANKHTEVMVVMTTNHPERIAAGMCRPGRIDSVIHIGELDAGGIERMTRVLIPTENLSPNVDWSAVGNAMVGFLPAYVKETVDRAQRYNLTRNRGVLTVIETDDLVSAAMGLRPQLEMMNRAPVSKTVDTLTETFASVMGNAVAVPIDSVRSDIENVSDELENIPTRIRQNFDQVAVIDYDGEVQFRLDVDL